MVLHRRYRRDIRHNLSLYVSATFLTVLSLLLFYLYYISGTGILRYGEEVFASQRVEDAHFSTYMEISAEDLKRYEKDFDVELEAQRYLNLETDGVTARVFQRTEKIDLCYIVEGRDVAADDEIVISAGYAQNKQVALGDKLAIRDKDYEVVGYMERPDYLYMLQNPGDADKNVTSFYLCCMTDDAFEALGDSLVQYLVRYGKDNSDDFRREVNEAYALRSYMAARDNLRITMMTDQPDIFLVMAYASLITLALMAVMLISIILSRKIRQEQKLIGTLAAYGYTKGQIARYYAGFAAIPGLLGGILTTVIVAICAQPYGELGLMDYEPLQAEFTLDVPQMILGIVLPTVMYVLSTVWTVHKLLKNDIAVLLAGAAKGKGRIRKALVGKKVPLRRKLCVRSVLGNPGRTCVLFFGVFLGSFVVMWAMGCLDTVGHISTATAENMGDYNYQYVLNEIREDNPYGGETMLAASLEDERGKTVSLLGADGNPLLGLRDEEGSKVAVDDGYTVTSLFALVHEVEMGDTVTLRNPLTLEEFSLDIDRIAKNDYANAVYTSRAQVEEMTGVDEGLFNVILSKDKLDIPAKKIVTVISRDTIDEQYEAALAQMNVLMDLLVGVGIVLSVIAVYIAVNMMISENRRHISMLGVLGYDPRRIRKLLLADNIWVVIPAILLSLPLSGLFTGALFRSFADVLGYVIEVYVQPSSYAFSVVLTLAGYYLSLGWVSRKIGRIDMVESLKDNRE